MSRGDAQRGRLASGWILVTGLLLLCITGTGLTWWNYTRRVFSSADGIVVSSDGRQSLVSVSLPPGAVRMIRAGQVATVTVGGEHQALKGRVLLSSPDRVDIRLGETPHPLTNGEQCSVTIDTTVPPAEEIR